MGVLTNKSIEEVSFTDIQELVRRQECESQCIEYKEQNYKISNSKIRDREIYELLKDVTSFANAEGGYIIIGVKQKDNKLGIPEKIVNVENAPEEQHRINQLCLSHIKPRISDMKIEVKSGYDNEENKEIILIWIPPISTALHCFAYQNQDECWKRYYRDNLPMKHDEIREFYVKMNSRINPKADKLTKEEKRLLISATEGSGEYIVLSNIAQLPGDVVLVKDKRHLYDYNDRSLTAMYYEAFQSLIRRKFIRYVGGVLYQLTGSGWQKGKELMNTKITDFNELIEIADDRFVQNQQQCKKKFERWYIAYQLLPLPTEKPLDELKQILMNVNTINANASNENNGSLEIWLKELHRYWYANPFGFYYETQPLPEDINESIFLAPSGYKILEWTNPIQDMTACIIHSIKVANLYKNIEQIRFSVKYHGLRDRILLNIHLKNTLNGPSFHSNQEFNFICRVDEWNNEIQLSPNIETQQLTDDLMNVVKSLLNPLYEKFNYQITDNVYREVISRMFKL